MPVPDYHERPAPPLPLLLVPPPPHPTASDNTKIEKKKYAILFTFPPLPYFLGGNARPDHPRHVGVPGIGAHVASRMDYQLRLLHRQRSIPRAPGLLSPG